MEALHIENLYKAYGDVQILQGINLSVAKGEFISLLGPSGCGKTTLLRIISGLVDMTSGKLLVNGKDISKLAPYERNNGMVFQNYALFPHMTVEENIAFGLKMRHIGKKEIKQKVKEGLALIHLEDLGKRYPKELSGGQQQRVALVRALVLNPTLLLLDEPLCNLDAQLRKEMRIEICNIQKKLNVTTIFVTHDQEEALTMSDRIAVVNQGVIEQIGTATQLYETPKTQFVANFIGSTNLIKAEVIDTCNLSALVAVCGGQKLTVMGRGDEKIGDKIVLSLRPERICLGRKKVDADNAFACIIANRIYLGGCIRFIVKTDFGEEYCVDLPSLHEEASLQIGEAAFVGWKKEHGLPVIAR